MIIYVTFILLSASAFNLDHVKLLSSWDGLKSDDNMETRIQLRYMLLCLVIKQGNMQGGERIGNLVSMGDNP